jgi:hypothetical protein
MRQRFAILEAIGDDAERQRFHLGMGLRLGLAIDNDARQGGHLGDPATVFLAFGFDPEHSGLRVLMLKGSLRGEQ